MRMHLNNSRLGPFLVKVIAFGELCQYAYSDAQHTDAAINPHTEASISNPSIPQAKPQQILDK